MNDIQYWLSRRLERLHHQLRKPTRVQSKKGKWTYRKIANNRSRSMMLANHPAGMKPAWSHIDDRTKGMLVKWHTHVERVKQWRSEGR